MKRKLVIDADPGIGDALAIALAVLDPDIELIGVTSVPGAVSGEMGLLNAQAIISLLDPPRWPRLGVTDGRAICPPANSGSVDPVFLNGETGLGELSVPHVELHNRMESARLLVDVVRDAPGEITLLTLGPLTNVVLACERSPELLGNLKEIVCCGGAMAVNGNVTAAAEYNMFAHPAAAQTVLTSLATKTLVPLDVTRRAMLSFDQFNRIKVDETTRLGRLIQQTIPFALRSHRQYLGEEGLTLHEVAALVSIVRPHLFERRRYPIEVEVNSELTRGLTILDRRKKSPRSANIDVLVDIDPQGVIDYLAEQLRRQC
ncbi:MAG: nucleoside hydrolase [Planctomycetaceae bacterium]